MKRKILYALITLMIGISGCGQTVNPETEMSQSSQTVQEQAMKDSVEKIEPQMIQKDHKHVFQNGYCTKCMKSWKAEILEKLNSREVDGLTSAHDSNFNWWEYKNPAVHGYLQLEETEDGRLIISYSCRYADFIMVIDETNTASFNYQLYDPEGNFALYLSSQPEVPDDFGKKSEKLYTNYLEDVDIVSKDIPFDYDRELAIAYSRFMYLADDLFSALDVSWYNTNLDFKTNVSPFELNSGEYLLLNTEKENRLTFEDGICKETGESWFTVVRNGIANQPDCTAEDYGDAITCRLPASDYVHGYDDNLLIGSEITGYGKNLIYLETAYIENESFLIFKISIVEDDLIRISFTYEPPTTEPVGNPPAFYLKGTVDYVNWMFSSKENLLEALEEQNKFKENESSEWVASTLYDNYVYVTKPYDALLYKFGTCLKDIGLQY